MLGLVSFFLRLGKLRSPRTWPAARAQFNASAHEQFTRPGSCRLIGQAAIRKQSGGMIAVPGGPVFLFPATSYFENILLRIRGGTNLPALYLDSDNGPLIRLTQCDPSGRFSFDAIPKETWFLAAEVGSQADEDCSGGLLLRRVAIDGRETNEVLLSDRDLIPPSVRCR